MLGGRPWTGWAVGAVSFAVAFLGRYHFSEAMAGLPFVTFFLAVLLNRAGGERP